MKLPILLLSATASVIGLAAPAASATYVDANSQGTFLGLVTAGKTYRITATGIVDLVGDQIPGGSFNLNADGIPQPAVTDPNYPYFNPGGSTTADGQSGPLPGANFGALIGILDPSSPVPALVQPSNSYFLIGTSLTTSFAQSGSLFGRVNDINTNNSGGFNVTITAVPEPATWGMMIMGFGAVGGAMRRRRAVRTTVRYA